MPPFPQGWGDAFEWFGSIAAIWRTQLQQPPKKYRRLPVALNRVRSRDTTSSETCSLLIVDSAGRCLGTVNSFFFFSRCFLDGWWCFWWNQDSGVVRKTSACPPTIPFPGLVDMFSKVFVDAQVFGRIQMAFRDLCIYLHMCFFFLKMEFAEIICKIDLTSFSLQFLGYHPFLTHSPIAIRELHKTKNNRRTVVLIGHLCWCMTWAMRWPVWWGSDGKNPWNYHGVTWNMEAMRWWRVWLDVVGGFYWVLLSFMVGIVLDGSKVGIVPQLRDWWRDADDKILIEVDQVTSRWLQEGFRLCPERCPLPRAKACWEC